MYICIYVYIIYVCSGNANNKIFYLKRFNMFNEKNPNRTMCNGYLVYSGDYSFIINVQWNDFIRNPNYYIEKSIQIRDNKDDYDITVNLS